MQRPRALVRRTSAFTLGFALVGSTLLAAGCASEVKKLPQHRSERESLGQEIYKVLCRRMAGVEMPEDLDGRRTTELCLGDQETGDAALEAQRAELTPRLIALAERRRALASALDELLPDDLGDGLEKLMREMLPFYDAPEERMQAGTRAMAAVLRRLAADDRALDAMTRFGRDGMSSADGEFGLFRALLGYDQLVPMLKAVLPPLTAPDGATGPAFKAALEGLALETATAELEAEPDSDTCRMRELLQRIEPPASTDEKRFASGAKLYAVARDVRGMPVPKRPGGETGADLASACGDGAAAAAPVPFPFVDANEDGFADIKGGQFVADPGFEGTLPAPFPEPFERSVARDQHGRAAAIGADSAPDARNQLYVTQDVDPMLLAALLRESARLFEGESSVLTNLAGALPALLGDTHQSSRTYQKAKLSYEATDPARSPLLDLVHAGGALLADRSSDESIELTLSLLRDHEQALVTSVVPLLEIERLTRPGDDQYPEAKLEAPNTFWDELLYEFEKLSRRRNSKGGETMLEAVVRSTLGFGRNFDKAGAPMEQLIDPRLLARQGALLAAMLRFKDEWRLNPDDKSDVIGFLQTPVDRSEGDTPVTCGKNGCGGPIAGTPFERWKKSNQGCMVQRAGQLTNGDNCGAPSNQSLFHRSMSMLAELEGRAQCNRPITVADLFEFAGDGTPADLASVREAEQALDEDYTCEGKSPCSQYAAQFPAAVPDLDGAGAGKPAIQECALIDVQDAGRVFGQVLTKQYQLQIPNPWVRRYLEDIARAANVTVTCDPHSISDPTKIPQKGGVPCVPNAAVLSRGMFEELVRCQPNEAGCIDTLGELIEFLLDDNSLFATEADTAALKPDPRALSRVMFDPDGSTGGFVLFDPLLLRGAPPYCTDAPRGTPVCENDDTLTDGDGECCIKDRLKPPLRFKIDTYYGQTTLAWEHSFKLSDGSELSFLDAMKPMADAFNRLDIPAGADPKSYEDTRYGLTTLGTIVAAHYDSTRSGSQNEDANRPWYRHLTGLVTYERLLADSIDDGSLDLAQKGPSGQPLFAADASDSAGQQLGLLGASVDLMEALDKLSFHGVDGLTATVRSIEKWLNPHAFCAGDDGDARVQYGKGACDQGGAREPLTYRDGRDYVCWNDGTCFDGKDGQPKRYVSPLYLTLDAASDVKRRSERDDALHKAARGVLSSLLDAFAAVENGRLKYRRLRAVALTLGDYTRERYAEEKAAGKLADWGKRTTDDMADSLDNPALAGGLLTLEKLAQEAPEALPALSGFLHSLLDDVGHPAQARAFMAYAADMLQMLPGDANALALAHAYATGFANNVDAVLAGQESVLDVENGTMWNSAFVAGEQAKADQHDVMGRMARNIARMPGDLPQDSAPLPLSALYDILIDINRANPLQDGPHSAADLRAAFTLIADVMLDEKRGFERMYRMVQCTTKSIVCD